MTSNLIRFHLDLYREQKRSGKYDQKSVLSSVSILDNCTRIFGWNTLQRTAALHSRSAVVVCSPEKFAEFLIWRCDAGFLNGFRELKARWVMGPPSVNPSLIPEITEGLAGVTMVSAPD